MGGERVIHNFNQKLCYSFGEQEQSDIDILKQAFIGSVSVIKTDIETDKGGADYIVTLRKGAKILIDAKTREPGASRYWRYKEPELALEKWSVCPDENGDGGKVGWTLNEECNVDMILYTFDPSDSKQFYLLPFQHLRIAFIRHYAEWVNRYGLKKQRSEYGLKWQSEAVFVPASIVINAIVETMTGEMKGG